MRNLRAVTCVSNVLPNRTVKDVRVDQLSGNALIATNDGMINCNLSNASDAFFTGKSINKIVFINHTRVCVQCDETIEILELPDQALVVRKFDDVIQTCVFSPDGLVGVVILENNSLFIISSELDLEKEILLPSLRNEKTNFLNVGWGKEETQFKGKKTGMVSASGSSFSNAPPAKTPLSSEITWREDGAYFAVSWVDKTEDGSSQRRIHILDSSGDLHSVCEETAPVEKGLCWRPKVSLIAVSKRCTTNFGGIKIVFYELNGLQHGEVDITTPDIRGCRVEKIDFDANEHIMAVLFVPTESNNAPPLVRLYTTSNYHWSTKMELSVIPPGANALCSAIAFGGATGPASASLYATAALADGSSCVKFLSFSSVIDRSAWTPDTVDHAIVSVIDGCDVRLTAFARTTVPPPLCGSLLTFAAPVTAMSVSPFDSTGSSLGLVQFAKGQPPLVLSLLPYFEDRKQIPLGSATIRQKVEQAIPTHAPSVTEAWPLSKDLVVSINDCAFDFLKNPLLHVTWISSTKLCFISHDGHSLGSITKLITGDRTTFEVRCLATTAELISGLVYTPSGDIAVQVDEGVLYFFCLKTLEDFADRSRTTAVFELSEDTALTARLPFVCDQLLVAPFRSSIGTFYLLVGLQSSSHRLCCLPFRAEGGSVALIEEAGEILMSDCLSLALHSDFLLVTTLDSYLLTVPLDRETAEIGRLVADMKEALNTSRPPIAGVSVGKGGPPRALDSGARLVVVVAGASKTVLQMPRGNLEVIHPRALVFSELAPLFDKCRHAETIATMRRHRINFNLLYDYNPKKFLSNVHNFVQNVLSASESITLLVSDLNEEDITKTEYNGFFGAKRLSAKEILAQSANRILANAHRPIRVATASESKVNRVCEALLKVMLPDTERFLFPILTCYVKKQPQEVDTCLRILRKFRDEGNKKVWDSGLRHLQYYVSPIRMFHLALGTYDLDLAEDLAARTQLDPKEYEPCLAQLRALAPLPSADGDSGASGGLYQRARIDLLLERYPSALRNLYAAGSEHWEEFCNVAKQHNLFSPAMELLKAGTPQFSELSRKWAESLESGGRLEPAAPTHSDQPLMVTQGGRSSLVAAGEVRLRAGQRASAARLFAAANALPQWRLATASHPAHLTPTEIDGREEHEAELSSDEVRKQAQKLADNLVLKHEYREAARLYLDYLKDNVKAATLLAQGGHWLEARTLAEQSGDLKARVNSSVDQVVLRAYEDLLVLLNSEGDEFYSTFERLVELRTEMKQKALSAAAAGLGEKILDDIESEIFSDTSSVSSVGSRSSGYSKSSGRSRKNRRKRERKKWSTKRGSRFEEVALIQVLHTAITSAQRLFGRASELANELWRCCREAEARRVVATANSLLVGQRASLPIIWCSEITGVNENGDALEPEVDGKPVRRYHFHEPFLLFPPAIGIQSIHCDYL